MHIYQQLDDGVIKPRQGRRKRPALVRFQEQYSPVTESGCWLWNGSTKYGMFTIDDGSMIGAHRASWILHKGEIPSGLFVCHKCDIPCCVNPDHLFLGTQSDNLKDMFAKNRADRNNPNRIKALPKGKRHHRSMAKLTEKQVLEIRGMNGSQRSIAEKFGVCQQLISKIKRNIYWSHI